MAMNVYRGAEREEWRADLPSVQNDPNSGVDRNHCSWLVAMYGNMLERVSKLCHFRLGNNKIIACVFWTLYCVESNKWCVHSIVMAGQRIASGSFLLRAIRRLKRDIRLHRAESQSENQRRLSRMGMPHQTVMEGQGVNSQMLFDVTSRSGRPALCS
jgi:hypothetical protein